MSEIQTVQHTQEHTAHPAQQEQQRPLPVPAQEGRQPAQGETHLAPNAVQAEQWLKMSATAILNEIEDGKITDPSVLPVLAKKGWMEQQLLIHSFIQQQPERKASHEADLAELEARYQPKIEGDKKALIQNCLQYAEGYMTFGYPYTTDNTNYDAAAKWYAMAARLAEEKAKDPVVAKPEQQAATVTPDQEPWRFASNQAETPTAAPQDREQQEADNEEEQKDTSKDKEKDPQDLNWEGIATLMEHPFSGLRTVLRSSFPEVTDEQFEAITDTLEYDFFELTEHFAEMGAILKDLFHGIISKTHGKEPWQPNGLAGMALAWEDRRRGNG